MINSQQYLTLAAYLHLYFGYIVGGATRSIYPQQTPYPLRVSTQINKVIDIKIKYKKIVIVLVNVCFTSEIAIFESLKNEVVF